MRSSCSGLCRTKSQEAGALVLKQEEAEWTGIGILYSSNLLTLLFLLLLSSRSQKRDVDKNPKEADSASDNEVCPVASLMCTIGRKSLSHMLLVALL